MMENKESYRQRQDNELEVIQVSDLIELFILE